MNMVTTSSFVDKKMKTIMKAFVRMAGAFFVPGVIRVFLCLFLWDLGGEPYGREQN